MKCGIYKIQHKESGRIYIGQSTNCYQRLHRHISDLKYGSHANMALQSTYKKYGLGVFVFEQILVCEQKDLSFYESLCVGLYKANVKPFGYNMRAVVDSNAGIVFDSKVFFPGDKYGRLTLIKRDILRKETSHWICLCECGTEKSISASGIKGGAIMSCGCAMRGINSKHKSGDRGGMLTLVSVERQNKHGQNVGLFNCDCGNTKKALVQAVMDGYVKSCGCSGRIKFVVLDGEKVSCMEATKRLGISSGAISNRVHRTRETYQRACDHYAVKRPPFVIVNNQKLSITEAARKCGFHRTSVTFRMKQFGESHQQAFNHFTRKQAMRGISA